ncbi:MAG: NAD-dependent epimerase/dehydratase family protein [Minisyncoccales bacterium]
MKYIITGGAGFIGSNLVECLCREGNEVIVIGVASKEFVFGKKIKFYEMEIKDSAVAGIFEKERPEIVYHLAGPINLRRPVDDPLFGLSANFFNDTKKILDLGQNLGIKKIVFTSSGGALYGANLPIPTPENARVFPVTLYGKANLMIEDLIENYYGKFDFPFTILRLSNVYGPRQWKQGIVPSIIDSIIEGKQIIINGNGEQTRDFIYVDDVVRALKRVAQTNASGTFNVGSGRETTINFLCERISMILGKKLNIVYQKDSFSGPQRSAVEISKIKKEFDWEPEILLDDGLRKTIEFYLLKK